jgi:hypothetical protein
MAVATRAATAVAPLRDGLWLCSYADNAYVVARPGLHADAARLAAAFVEACVALGLTIGDAEVYGAPEADVVVEAGRRITRLPGCGFAVTAVDPASDPAAVLLGVPVGAPAAQARVRAVGEQVDALLAATGAAQAVVAVYRGALLPRLSWLAGAPLCRAAALAVHRSFLARLADLVRADAPLARCLPLAPGCGGVNLPPPDVAVCGELRQVAVAALAVPGALRGLAWELATTLDPDPRAAGSVPHFDSALRLLTSAPPGERPQYWLEVARDADGRVMPEDCVLRHATGVSVTSAPRALRGDAEWLWAMQTASDGPQDDARHDGLGDRADSLLAALLCDGDGGPVPYLSNAAYLVALYTHAGIAPPEHSESRCGCPRADAPWHARRCPRAGPRARSAAHRAVQAAVRGCCVRAGLDARVEVRTQPGDGASPRADIVVALPAGPEIVVEVKTLDLDAPSWTGTVAAREARLAAGADALYPGCATLVVTRCCRTTAAADALAILQAELDRATNSIGVDPLSVAAAIAAAVVRAEAETLSGWRRRVGLLAAAHDPELRARAGEELDPSGAVTASFAPSPPSSPSPPPSTPSAVGVHAHGLLPTSLGSAERRGDSDRPRS